MIKGKYGQAKCSACNGWHFAIQLDDNYEIKELKCCRCNLIENVKHFKKVEYEIDDLQS